MDMKQVQAKLDAMVPVMLSKGMREPEASVTMRSDGKPCVGVTWKSKRESRYSSTDTAYEYFHADTLDEAFERADAFLVARPTAEQAKLNEFLAVVGAAADLGRELGIDAEFVNPLVATMKKLSENALTFQAAAE